MGIPSQGYGFSTPQATASVTSHSAAEPDDCPTGPDVSLVAASPPRNCIRLSWGMRPSYLDPMKYVFEVQRSNSPVFRDGDYTVLVDNRVGILEYEDLDINLENLFRQVYYRIVARSIEEPSVSMISAVVRWRQRQDEAKDLVAREIRWRMAILLERYTGIPCAYYPVMTQGNRCHACYDEITQRCSDSKCTTCFRTTFYGGYHLPIPRYVQFSPTPQRPSLDVPGKEHRTFASAIMEHDPIARPGDLIKDLQTGEVWDVAAVEPPTSKLGHLVHQNLVLYKLDRDDIEYQVPGEASLIAECPLEWHAVLG